MATNYRIGLALGHIAFWGLVLWGLSLIRLFALVPENIDEFGQAIEKGAVIATSLTHPYFFLSRLLGGIFLFYVQSEVLFKNLFLNNKKLLYVLALIALVLTTKLLQAGLETIIIENCCTGVRIEYPGFNVTGHILISFAIISVAYSFVRQWAADQEIKKNIEQDNLLKEIQSLRFQINPHFLYNTINSLFWISNKKNDQEMTEGLSLLADMMRYMLDGDQGAMKELTKEANYIESYVHLQKIRFEDDGHVEIHFKNSGTLDEWLIHPTILITFVENAFKHGIGDAETSIIKIKLEMDEDLFFYVSNTKAKNSVIESTGIGVSNVIKRLDLLYPDNYNLTIQDLEDTYEITLELKLQKR